MKCRLANLVLLSGLSAVVGATDLPGELGWAHQVSLGLPVTGYVEQLPAQPGMAVAAGQLLLQLDPRIVRAQLERARSAMKHAGLQRDEAQREWKRAQELFDRTVLSERELQVAEIGLASADAEYQTARAALVAAEATVGHHSLKAPFDARVLAIHVTLGQAVVNAHEALPLVTLVARDRMRAHATVNAAQAAAVRRGAAAQVRVGDQDYDAQIVDAGMAPLGTQRPAVYPLVMEFTVPQDTVLRAGQAATLILP